jgi:hypothetical protein
MYVPDAEPGPHQLNIAVVADVVARFDEGQSILEIPVEPDEGDLEVGVTDKIADVARQIIRFQQDPIVIVETHLKRRIVWSRVEGVRRIA